MKKTLIFLAAMFLLSCNAYAFPETYYFQLSVNDGTGKATMEVDTSGDTMTILLDNTSPVDLDSGDDGDGWNSPGITAFGFDLEPDQSLQSWSLEAYSDQNNLQVIGKDLSGPWSMNESTKQEGVTREFLPNAGVNIDDALFNPDSDDDDNNTLPGGNNDVYFTTATLTMNFLDLTDLSSFNNPYVRMKNVGLNGEGSLKLDGSTGGGGGGGTGTVIPEPGTMLLLGTGLIGFSIIFRRRRG